MGTEFLTDITFTAMKKTIITLLLGCMAISITATPASGILTLKESITDNAIVYPESFETDTHKMMQNWYIQNYTSLDESNSDGPVVTVSDDVYIKRLREMPTVIEMPFNQIVRSHIEMYTQRKRQLVETMLGMSLYYMPIFEQALEKEGLPLELKYLPVIESALNPNAVSRVGATGLWQFMLPTARGLGMEINSLVDERRDPIRSSEMAAKYLKQLYEIYGDWSLAIASYNCGPGNVNKAIRRAGGGKKDFWEIYYHLPAETRGYVPGFIAANYVMNYYNQHNISPALAKRPIITDSIHINKRVHFNQISEVLNIPVDELRVLNPQFRKDVIPGDIHPYALILPSKQVYCYIMSEDSIISHKTELYAQRTIVNPTDIYASDGNYTTKLVVKYHKVKRGETLNKIAKRYGVKMSDIKKWNKLKRNKLKRGQKLKINTYQRIAKPKDDKEEIKDTSTDNRVLAQDSTVQDSLLLAKREAPTDSTHLTSDTDITVKESTGKKASKKKESSPKPQYRYHTVKRGENLSKIAKKYRGVTVADIKKANGITGTKIKAGQKLKIPRV